MEKINVNKITERQKLTIRNGINTYMFIMAHQDEDDDDFREVYYSYYLTARSAVFAKKKMNKETKKKEDNPNWEAYFSLLHKTDGHESLMSIVEELQKGLVKHSLEFSFVTKLLHTKNNQVPIYDSKVRKYLKEVYGETFKTEKENSLDNIQKDWETLVNWYDRFLKSEVAKQWITWFDSTFPEGKEISAVKKIDTIIFSCVN